MSEEQPVGNVERNGGLKLEHSAVMRVDCVGRWEKEEEGGVCMEDKMHRDGNHSAVLKMIGV
jgi:hypothetical protein